MLYERWQLRCDYAHWQAGVLGLWTEETKVGDPRFGTVEVELAVPPAGCGTEAEYRRPAERTAWRDVPAFLPAKGRRSSMPTRCGLIDVVVGRERLHRRSNRTAIAPRCALNDGRTRRGILQTLTHGKTDVVSLVEATISSIVVSKRRAPQGVTYERRTIVPNCERSAARGLVRRCHRAQTTATCKDKMPAESGVRKARRDYVVAGPVQLEPQLEDVGTPRAERQDAVAQTVDAPFLLGFAKAVRQRTSRR